LIKTFIFDISFKSFDDDVAPLGIVLNEKTRDLLLGYLKPKTTPYREFTKIQEPFTPNLWTFNYCASFQAKNLIQSNCEFQDKMLYDLV
jgi:hypothetical protein